MYQDKSSQKGDEDEIWGAIVSLLSAWVTVDGRIGSPILGEKRKMLELYYP
jgi:hypothetical protein